MGIALLIDEDLGNRSLVRAIESHNAANPSEAIDAVRVGDPGAPPCGALDPDLIAWAQQHRRLIVSCDVSTLIDYHNAIVARGNSTPGLVILRKGFDVPTIVECFNLICNYMEPEEIASSTRFLPEAGR